MHTFAMILDNPGEQPHQTRYRDPGQLKALGYSDLIVYPTTGLSGLLGPDTLANADLRRWVEQQYDSVQTSVSDARRAGLGAWLMYDAPALAAELVGSAMTCIDPPGTAPAPGTGASGGAAKTLCPASDELLDMCGQALEALVARIDGVDGIVLRLGDSDAAKIPYLVGNDVYLPHCSRCASLGRADRLVRFVQFFYELVVQKLGRKLIVRAWNVRPGGMHDNPELCQRVVERLPKDDRLILSFKFTQTDFWRYQRWNPSSLVCGDRPIIYELQCQREFEGKGAVPNYQAPLWRDGMTELDGAVGLAYIAPQVNLAGLWAWVRGGGWRGPYINPANEMWIDVNVYAVPRLAADPQADTDDLVRRWIAERLGVTDAAAPGAGALLQVLKDSPRNVLEMFYIGPYAKGRPDPWRPSASFIQDDQIDAEAAWGAVQRLSDAALDEVVGEKQAAEHRLTEDQRLLQQVMAHLPAPLNERLPLSLQYTITLAQTLRSLLGGLVAYRRWMRRGEPALTQSAEKSMRICQSCWVHHTQRIATHGGPSPFSSDNLWDVTQRVIEHVHQGQGAAP